MHRGATVAPDRDRTGSGQERSLNDARYAGSYATADFPLHPPLPEIGFLGRSNAGKSSLINALVGRRSLAHTSRTPGKTRTLNVYAVNGRFYLVDLPGYGYARAPRSERRRLLDLVRDYLGRRDELAGVVWLLDIRHEPSAEDRETGGILAGRRVPVLAALTKADKVSRGRWGARIRDIAGAVGLREDQCIVTSARTREGMGELRDAIHRLLDRAAASPS